jgi:phage portal protein BeeE
MGIVLNAIDGAIARAAGRGGRREAREQRVPAQASLVSNDAGRQGKTNVKLFRHWAEHSELVRGAIDIRRGQVATATWDIVPADPDKPYSEALKAQIKRLFDVPNPTRASFRSFTEPVLEDVLVLDAGSIEKVRNLRGQIAELWYLDGGEVKVSKYWDGDPDQPRYFWYPDGQPRASWSNADFTYIMSRPASYRVVGLSSMEVLKLTIDAELGGSAYNARQVTSAAPDGMLDLGEGVRPDQVEKFKAYWLSEIAGKGAMAILGGSRGAKFLPFRQSNRDMQFVEWQNYLLRKTALVFQMSPVDLNAVTDVNRASAGVLQENTDDRGIRPLLGLMADYYTREIVWDEGFGGQDNNLAFAFTKLNQRETLDAAKVQAIQTGDMPTRTTNELRKKDGLEPWGPEFDVPMVVVGNQVVRLENVPTAGDLLEAQKKPEPAGEKKPATGKESN